MSCYILVLSRWDVQTPGPTEDEEQPQAEEKVQGPQRTEILDSALQMSRLLQTCLSSTEALILPSAILTHDPGPQDVVFVALDFEGFPLPWQIGIATLDARDLLHPQASLDPSQLISTKNYIHLTPSRTAYWSHRKERFGFSFGEEQRACQRDIRRILLSSLQIRDTAGYSDQLRKTVLVGHELSNEVKIMARLEKVYSPPSRERHTLKGLLTKLGCRQDTMRFHNAGNDANFTMRALLMLAVKSQANVKDITELGISRLALFENIAKGPIPFARESQIHDRDRKRAERAREFQMQDRDRKRAERARKVQENVDVLDILDDMPVFSELAI